MKDVEKFLIENGFTETKPNVFSKGKCNIIMHLNDKQYGTCYEIYDGKGAMYTDNLNIYCLIGILTYYGFMDKDYKQSFKPTGSFI